MGDDRRGRFRADDLKVVLAAPAARLLPPGSFVRLNSGGPVGVVMELMASDDVLVMWLTDDRQSSILPEACVSPAWWRPD